MLKDYNIRMKSFKLSQEVPHPNREVSKLRDRIKDGENFSKLGDTEVEWKHPITSLLSKEEISPLK
jgi:hypothetical protein